MDAEAILAELKFRMDQIEYAFIYQVITRQQMLTSLAGEFKNAERELSNILGRRLQHVHETPLVRT